MDPVPRRWWSQTTQAQRGSPSHLADIEGLSSEAPRPAATAGDSFGYSVAVSGETIVVGTAGGPSFPGVAYVYARSQAGWPTTPTVTLSDPAATAGDSFGASVAVSGKTVAVGASGTDLGHGVAYIYVKG